MSNPRLLWLCPLLLLVLQSSSAHGARSPGKQWNHRILSSQLVAPGVGWVVLQRDWSGNDARMRLYWTEDDGRHWLNITPPDMVTHHISDVFFLDRTHGWFVSSDALSEEADASFYLFSTGDGGRSWRSLVLRRPTFGISDDYTFPTQVSFADPQHGWMLWHWHMMNSSVDYLISTNDGGRTWNRLPDAPGIGPIQFTSPNDGWAIGTSTQDVGIPTPGNDALFVTHDGGKKWSELRIPLPSGMDAEHVELVSLRFKNERVGSILFSEQFRDGHFVSTVCETRDGGRTWHLTPSNGAPQNFSLLDSGHIRAYYDPDYHSYGNLHIQNGKHNLRPRMPDDIPLAPGFSFPSFLDRSNGWMSTGSVLLATTDGGKSFHMVLPSPGEPEWFRPPQILSVNGQGGLSPEEKNLQPVVAGGLTIIHGAGFLGENVISFDKERMKVPSGDGETLRFVAPSDLPSGLHSMRIENAHGKSEPVEVSVCGLGRPRILAIHSGFVDASRNVVAYRGKSFSLEGCGFLKENRIVFEAEIGVGRSEDGINLHADVPASLTPGIYEIYVINEYGSSDSVSLIVK